MSTFPPLTLGRTLNNVFDPLQPRAGLTLSNIVGTTTDTGTRVFQNTALGLPGLFYHGTNVAVPYGGLYTIVDGDVYPIDKTATGLFTGSGGLKTDIVTYQVGNLTVESPAPPPSPPSPPSTFTQVSSGSLITDVMMSEYIRPRTLTFQATGLKPSTVVHFLFDGVNVDSQVVQTSPTPSGGVFKTGTDGSISGTFDLPFGRFFVGDRIFAVSDRSDGDITQQSTGAQTRYTAYGLELTTTTLNIPAPEPPRPVDPLAQSFFIDPYYYPQGVFISKADLYIKKKDDNVPLFVQIREMVNGYPSSTNVISTASVAASSVNTSDDGSVATTVQFPNVVYLAPGEYCIVLLANSVNYEAWVAQIGDKQVGSNNLISQQPYVGSLFKSQNASTWTAEQTQDLTFKLYLCKFSGGEFDVVFTDWNAANLNPVHTVSVTTAAASVGATGVPFDLSSVVDLTNDTITIPGHAYSSGSKVTYYQGASGTCGLTNATDYYVNAVNSDVIKLYSSEKYAIVGGATGLVNLSAVSLVGTGNHFLNGGANVLYLKNVIDKSINVGAAVSGTGIPSSTVVTSVNPFDNTVCLSKYINQDITTGQTITVNRKSEGGGVSDLVMLNNPVFNPFTDNTVSTSFKSTVYYNGATGLGLETGWTAITPNANYTYNGERYINTVGESFQKKISSTIDGVTSYVSPVINAARQSVTSVAYKINNLVSDTLISGATGASDVEITVSSGSGIQNGQIIQIDSEQMQVLWGGGTQNLIVSRGVNSTTAASHSANATITDTSETQTSGGNAKAKYITRKVTLASSASYLKVYLSVNKPANSDVYVYYKVRSNSDSDVFASKKWIKMSQSTPASNTFSTNSDQYIEYTYLPADANTDSTSGNRKITYSVGSVSYTDFIEYAVKIVLVSTDPTAVPVVAEFRSIATE